jgi:hypothetical protein
MDEVLSERYRLLFLAYEAGGQGITTALKQRIYENLGVLRFDAALCLLTLFDQMIIRPYLGRIESASPTFGNPLPLPSHPHAFPLHADAVFAGLDRVLSQMSETRKETQSSSHEVIQAIEAVWPSLAEMFGWA